MNLPLLLESLKFHRIKQESAVRLLFVFCYLVNTAVYFIPGSDPDLSGFLYYFESLAKGQAVELVYTQGNLVFFGLTLAASLLTLLSIFLYAGIFAGEREGKTAIQAFKGFLRSLPGLLVVGLMLIIPALLAAFMLLNPILFLLVLPILFLVTALYFLPLNLNLGRLSLTEALESSYRDTRHMKFFIFLHMLMLSIVMSLPESLVFRITGIGGLAAVLVSGFFIAARALMHGRLMGLLYLNLVKKVPIVITSKPNA